MDTMTSPESPVIERMQALIARWEEQADPRSVFLSCYLLMTRNMLSAIDRGEFTDPAWADRLLHRFADYYFVALDAYEQRHRSRLRSGSWLLTPRAIPIFWCCRSCSWASTRTSTTTWC